MLHETSDDSSQVPEAAAQQGVNKHTHHLFSGLMGYFSRQSHSNEVEEAAIVTSAEVCHFIVQLLLLTN